MSQYTSFFFNSGTGVVELELIEISHPSFSKVYRVVRNSVQGVSVQIEDGSTQAFEFYPVKLTPNGANSDLDQTMQLSVGDVGMVVPQELDRMYQANTFGIKPIVLYRTYRSDVLTAPMTGPVKFQAQSVAFKKEGATFDISAPRLNLNKTGEVYNLNRFDALRLV